MLCKRTVIFGSWLIQTIDGKPASNRGTGIMSELSREEIAFLELVREVGVDRATQVLEGILAEAPELPANAAPD